VYGRPGVPCLRGWRPRKPKKVFKWLLLAVLTSLVSTGVSAQPTASDVRGAKLQARESAAILDKWAELQVSPSEPKPRFDDDLRLLGAEWYRDLCVACHGERGDGRGTWASRLTPRPRDFTRGVYEFRSTPTGTLPTDDDIWR